MANDELMTDRMRKADKSCGRFITLEGIEGSGKSTLLPYIRAFLETAGKSVVVTREPGGTPLGEEIRRLLLDPTNDSLTSSAELLMIFAARVEHLEKVIKPALRHGRWIVCDRFTDATYVYQGEGRHIPKARIDALVDWAQSGVRADLTLIFDVPVSIGLRRVNQRGEKDRFEREEQRFFERLRNAYLMLAAEHPSRCCVIDASVPLEVVRRRVDTVLKGFLQEP